VPVERTEGAGSIMSTGVIAAIKHRKQTWLVGVFFLCCLFPFISPVPIDTDTQPLFLAFAAIIVARRALYVGLHAENYYLFGLTALSLIYINPSFEYTVDVGKAVSIAAGVLTFIAATRINDQQAYLLVKRAALIYFIYSCLIYLNSSFFLSLQENFVRGVNVGDFSNLDYRGVPALATEPGLLGGLLVFLLIQLQYYGTKINASAKEMVAYGVVIVLTILMTKSGTGYLYLLIFLMLTSDRWVSRNRFVRICLLATVLIFLALAVPILVNLELSNRGIEVLIALASGVSLDADTSVLKRLYDLRIGIESLFDFPFGVGVNGVAAAVNELAIRHDLLRVNDIAGDISLVSGLSFYFVSYGLLGFAFIIYLFIFLSRAPILHKVFALIYLSASYSPAFPAIWILLSQTSKKIQPISVRPD
jgi:hypothetical protein